MSSSLHSMAIFSFSKMEWNGGHLLLSSPVVRILHESLTWSQVNSGLSQSLWKLKRRLQDLTWSDSDFLEGLLLTTGLCFSPSLSPVQTIHHAYQDGLAWRHENHSSLDLSSLNWHDTRGSKSLWCRIF